MNATFTDRLIGALNAFFEGVVRFLPGLLAAVVIVLIGLVVGWILRAAVRRALSVARFDHFCESTGISQILDRADIRAKPSGLAGTVFFWIWFVTFAMAGLSALDVAVINRLIAEFFLYLPRILSALLILLLGFLLGNFLSRAILLAAVNAGLPSPRGISLVVKFLIAILSFAMALEQLEIAKSIVLAAFIISFGSVMLGLAIAFGIGGRDVARRVLERRFGDRPAEGGREDGFSHL
ncbi:MAG: mechanosensitive ion channel family protein [Acidobacteriota bacterium]